MRWLIALLWAVPLWGQQIAVGDSVQYNGGRYEVRFVAGEPTCADGTKQSRQLGWRASMLYTESGSAILSLGLNTA